MLLRSVTQSTVGLASLFPVSKIQTKNAVNSNASQLQNYTEKQ